MTIRAVLFDLDGTLVDSNELHVLAWQQAFRDAGREIDPAAIRGQIGKGADKLVPALVDGADEDMAERLGEAHGVVFKDRYLDLVKPFPGARDLLARTATSGRTVAFASSASAEELDHYLGLLDARALVSVTTSIDDVEDSKPAPDIFAVALTRAGVAADEAIAVGDSPYDVAAARRCGIGTVALRSGGFSDDALDDAVAIHDDAAALLAAFADSPLNR